MDLFAQTRANVLRRCRERDKGRWETKPPKPAPEGSPAWRKAKLRSRQSLAILCHLWSLKNLTASQIAQRWAEFHGMEITTRQLYTFVYVRRDLFRDRRVFNPGRPRKVGKSRRGRSADRYQMGAS